MQDIVNATAIASCFFGSCTEECFQVSSSLVQTYACVIMHYCMQVMHYGKCIISANVCMSYQCIVIVSVYAQK